MLQREALLTSFLTFVMMSDTWIQFVVVLILIVEILRVECVPSLVHQCRCQAESESQRFSRPRIRGLRICGVQASFKTIY
jgi:hypothetical protein